MVQSDVKENVESSNVDGFDFENETVNSVANASQTALTIGEGFINAKSYQFTHKYGNEWVNERKPSKSKLWQKARKVGFVN